MARFTAFPDPESESGFSEAATPYTGYDFKNTEESISENTASGPRAPPAAAPSCGGLRREASTSSTASVYFPGAYRETYDQPKHPSKVVNNVDLPPRSQSQPQPLKRETAGICNANV